MSIQTFVHRLAGHLHTDLDPGTFERLALEAFGLQFEALDAYRRLCEHRGVTPAGIERWQDIPAVPVAAFKTMRLHLAPPREVFRSSGTTGGQRSVHYHPFPNLYRQVIDATFPEYCLPKALRLPDAFRLPDKVPMLGLVPSRQRVDDSSLGFMVDHVLKEHAGSDSQYAFGDTGVEVEVANAWCRRRQLDGRPGLILGTSFALAQWLETLTEQDLRWSLPEGSAIFDTGGFKGRTRQLSPRDLERWSELHLAVPASRWVREYGMTELTSQFYTQALMGGDRETFVGPPWLKAHLLDPVSLQPVEDGESGLLAILDLANAGSVLHVLTQDLGIRHDDGFRLLGRASGAELRGCSLTVEELER